MFLQILPWVERPIVLDDIRNPFPKDINTTLHTPDLQEMGSIRTSAPLLRTASSPLRTAGLQPVLGCGNALVRRRAFNTSHHVNQRPPRDPSLYLL